MKSNKEIYELIEKGIGLKELNDYLIKNRESFTKDDVLLIINKFSLHN